MKVGEVWKHKHREDSLLITKLFRRKSFLNDGRLADFVSYTKTEDETGMVEMGDMPVSVLLRNYYKDYDESNTLFRPVL